MARYSETELKDTLFVINGEDIEKSPDVSDTAKKNIKENRKKEKEKIAESIPSDFLSVEEVEVHENEDDQPSVSEVVKVNKDGEEKPSSYTEKKKYFDQLKDNEDSYYDSKLYNNDNNIDYEPQPDVYLNANDNLSNETYLSSKSSENYGDYVYVNQKNTLNNNSSKDDINVNVPATQGKIDIYRNGKKVSTENYILIQGKIVIKKYSKPLLKMIESAKKDGVILKINDAFRSFDEQLELRKKNIKQEFMNKLFDFNWLKDSSSRNFHPLTGRPGWSRHSDGGAFDFETSGGRNTAYKWLVKNAVNYGFIRTVASETWHWEYKPSKYNNKDAYTRIPKNHESWMGLSNTTVYYEIDNSLGSDKEPIVEQYTMSGYDENKIENVCKPEAKNRLLNKLKSLGIDNYNGKLLYQKETKKDKDKIYLTCIFKTNESF